MTVDNNDKTDCCVDIRYHWCSPIDHNMYLTPQGLSLTFEQFDKLKDVAKVLPDLIPDLNTTLPCYMSHQNVEELYIVVNVIPTEPISTRSITAHSDKSDISIWGIYLKGI